MDIFYGVLTLEKVPKSRNIVNFGIFLVQEIARFFAYFHYLRPDLSTNSKSAQVDATWEPV